MRKFALIFWATTLKIEEMVYELADFFLFRIEPVKVHISAGVYKYQAQSRRRN